MDHMHSSSSAEGSRKFPLSTLLIAVVILAGAAAILVFNVPVFTVLSYGFLGLMLFGHMFMHAGHGGHDHGASPYQQNHGHVHGNPDDPSMNGFSQADGPANQGDETPTGKDQDPQQGHGHSGHSGCC